MILNRLISVSLLLVCIACSDKRIETNDQEESQSGAGQAIDQWIAVRFSENTQVSANALVDANLKIKSNFRAQDKAKWKAIGPKNIGGRTLCLAFHPTDPNVIYAGSASGGLWKTSSAGIGYHGWVQVPISLPVYSIASILISPRNPDIIFIGTGEVYNKSNSIPGIVDRHLRGTYGMGILKSYDGGRTWDQVLKLSNSIITGVQDMKFDPFDDQIVYAATTQGLYKSTDGGLKWILIHDVPMAVDIEVNYTNPEILFVTHGSFNDQSISGIYKSNNSGGHFVKLTNGLPATYSGKAKIDISRSNPSIMYASVADESRSIGLYKSIDAGLTWDLMNTKDVAGVQGWYSHDVAIHPTNPKFISYAGINVFISDNSGTNFINATSWDAGDMGRIPVGGPEGDTTIYVHADVHGTYFNPHKPDEIFFATDGGIFVGMNQGAQFHGRNGGYQTTQFYANFSASRTDPQFAIGGMQDNGTAIFDGNDGWIKVIGGDGMSTAINFNETIIYGSYQYFGLNKSTDKGKSFEYIRPNNNILYTEQIAFNTPYEITPSNPSALYAGGQRIYINENNGNPNSWRPLHEFVLDANATTLALAVSPADPLLIFVSTFPLNNKTVPKLFKSTNGGITWQHISNLPETTVMDISFDPNNANTLYLAYSGFTENSHVFKSVDAGRTWENIDHGLPNVPTNCIAINPKKSNEIYVGNDLGVFVSENSGKTWEKFTSGLPNTTMVMSLSITPTPGLGIIKVATHGNGVYESPLADFSIVTKEITNPLLSNLILSPNPADNFIAVNTFFKQSANYRISISDLHGRTMLEKTNSTAYIGENVSRIDISLFPSGVYNLRLEGKMATDKSRFLLIRKFVKK